MQEQPPFPLLLQDTCMIIKSMFHQIIIFISDDKIFMILRIDSGLNSCKIDNICTQTSF